MMRFIGIVAGTALLLVLMSSAYNLAIAKWQYAHNPVPGNFYTVDGKQMHLNCTGAGSPTVVIEAGASSNSLGWQGVQPKLSQLTRVCSYDRPGHGWSEPRPGPHDAETIARRLHALLDQAREQRPLVLLGHSAGGLYIREYAREFPAEVVGAVMIDSSSPRQIDEFPRFRQDWEADKHAAPRQLRIEQLRVWSGWDRVTGNCHDKPSPEEASLAGQYDAEMCRPEYVGEEDNELPYYEASFKQADRLTSFGHIPLLVMSRDPSLAKIPAEIAEQPIWDHEQEALKSLSPVSWRVIARGGSHSLHHQRLDLVLVEITRLIDYLRGGPAPPFGTTTYE